MRFHRIIPAPVENAGFATKDKGACWFESTNNLDSLRGDDAQEFVHRLRKCGIRRKCYASEGKLLVRGDESSGANRMIAIRRF